MTSLASELEWARAVVNEHGWNEWICHSNFSFLIGASDPGEYLERAATFGYRGLAMTDYDGVYGLARAHRKLRDLRKGAYGGEKADGAGPGLVERAKGLRLFHGAELHLAPDHNEPIWLQNTLVFICRNLTGYGNLCRIISRAHERGKVNAYVSFEHLLEEDLSHLAVIMPMRGVIRWGHEETWLKQVAALKERCSGGLFAALSRHWHPAEDRWIPHVLRLTTRLDVPILFSQDAYFHAPSQKDVSDVMHAIRLNQTVGDAMEHLFVNGERSLRPLPSLIRSYSGIEVSCGGKTLAGRRLFERACATSASLAAGIQFDLSELRYSYPKEMLPPGYSSQAYLEELTWQGATRVYGETPPEKIQRLLRHELQLIEQLAFADYFLTVWDIVAWARQQSILCQGRGSAANSAVCYVLGVTAVNPATFDLLFERFISVERGDPPDIDVDFEHERREEVIQYIYRRYGRAKAAMVANVITFRSRGSIRAVGKALGVPEIILKQASRVLDRREFRSNATLETIQKVEQELREEHDPMAGMIPWHLWSSLSQRVRGFPRHLGIHSGGFVLSDRPLNALVPQEPATMAGRTVIQWCKEDIEALGFFKIDILALGMLTAIRRCFDLVKTHHGDEVRLETIPADDGPTYAMIQKADTIGTFQIESRAQMSMLPRLKPRCFYDLVIEVAIIRPGPIQGGMIHPFLRRRNGEEPVSYPDERLRTILQRTLGVPIFQEQVMRIAMAVGGFSPGEADELRRNMGAWSMKGDLTPLIAKLAEGMRRNGLSEEFSTSLLKQLRGFADYGFPESHAASFALLAYASSYLKCYYPEAFFAALLNSQPMGFYPPHVLIQAARRAGVDVRPVCVARSNWDATLEKRDIDDSGLRPFALRLGMSLVRGLSEKGAQGLVQRRHVSGGWRSWAEFLKGQTLARDDLAALAAANAFATFGVERRSAQWRAEALPFSPLMEESERAPIWEQESVFDTIQQDFASTSTSLGPHPTEVIRSHYWCFPQPAARVLRAGDLDKRREGDQVCVFGMVIVRQSPPTAKGVVFISLEDATGYINLILHPQVFRRFHLLVERQAFLCVVGKLQPQPSMHSILVRQVLSPHQKMAPVLPMTASSPPLAKPSEAMSEPLAKARNYM